MAGADRGSSAGSGWTPAIEDYVKAIYLLGEAGDEATGMAIAARLDVSQASVTAMVKKLAEHELVVYEPYQPVSLTEKGRLVALEVVRHHRLLELFLAESLGMSWDRIHAEAEVLEHHISEELEDLIAAKLGHPEFDPHGHPIPSRDGLLPTRETRPVAALETGGAGTVRKVSGETAELLRFLTEQGMVVGALLEVVESSPMAGTVTVAVGPERSRRTIGLELAGRIHVEVS